MRLEIGNWTLEKAKGKATNDKVIPIRMIANRLKLDKERQEILPQAFNKATVNHFLKNGIVDYHHESVLGKTPSDRAQAILGRPTDFGWEKEDGVQLPAVYANLTKAHPIVKNFILPHLEAEQDVFNASVGGDIKKAKRVHDPGTNQIKEQISQIRWDHIAIAGKPYVISEGSNVSLCKAFVPEQAELQNIEIFRFADVDAFETDYELLSVTGEQLRKAMTIGAETDSAKLTGGSALRTQSKLTKYTNLVNEIITGIKKNNIALSSGGVRTYLKAEGLNDKEIKSFMAKLVASAKRYNKKTVK
jgi:hypothetical protein